MRKLEDVLFESRVRADNLLFAVQLGLLGKNRSEIVEKVKEFNVENKSRVDTACAEVKEIINSKRRLA
jgi:hypothetical protein